MFFCVLDTGALLLLCFLLTKHAKQGVPKGVVILQQQQQQQHQQRQRQTCSTAVRHAGHHHFNAQPNYYNPTRGWQALKRYALTSRVLCCCCFVLLVSIYVCACWCARSSQRHGARSPVRDAAHRRQHCCAIIEDLACSGFNLHLAAY